MSKRVEILTDHPLVLAEECEYCGGSGDAEGLPRDPLHNHLCDACKGRGQVITDDGRLLLRWIAENIGSVARNISDSLDEIDEETP